MAKKKIKATGKLSFNPENLTIRRRVGRAPAITDKDKLIEYTNKYFDLCDENKIKYTVSGLANVLGVDRTTLRNYKTKLKMTNITDEEREVAKVVNQAYSIIEEQTEIESRSNAPTGAIFNLKNNYENWDADNRQTVKHEGSISEILQSIEVPHEVIDAEYQERIGIGEGRFNDVKEKPRIKSDNILEQ